MSTGTRPPTAHAAGGHGDGPRPAGELLESCLRAVQHLEAVGTAQPRLLVHWPVARGNPFQVLLYRGLWQRGVAPVGALAARELEEVLPLLRLGYPVALHLHWLAGVLDGVVHDADAQRRIDTFLARLDAVLAAGATLVWTVHNVLPHDSVLPSWEARLRQQVADRATLVHALTPATTNAVAEWFVLPADRMVQIPHPGYQGCYPDYVGRDQARFELGVDPDEVVYGLVGAIRPYKGLTELLEAFTALVDGSERPRRLVVGGQVGDDPVTQAFVERCRLHPRVIVHPRRVATEDMQRFLNASDIAVLPYRRSLNSGVLLLALTFGKPVVAPASEGVESLLTPEMARTFVPGDSRSLAEALRAADALLTPRAGEAARAVADQYHPDDVSARFAEALVSRGFAR